MQIARGCLCVVLGIMVCVSLVFSASVAQKSYMRIQGTKQGTFKGQSRNGGKWSEVVSFSYKVEAPRDAQTGQASGKRQHKPVVITKEVDEASPQIFRAATTNEVLKEVVIETTRAGGGGKEQVYQRIVLTNAQINNVRKFAGPRKTEQEEISFTFQKIQVTDEKGKITATDDWLAPK